MYDHVAWLMDGQGFALELRDEMAKTTWLIARILNGLPHHAVVHGHGHITVGINRYFKVNLHYSHTSVCLVKPEKAPPLSPSLFLKEERGGERVMEVALRLPVLFRKRPNLRRNLITMERLKRTRT